MYSSDLTVMADIGFPQTAKRIRDELDAKRTIKTMTFYIASRGENDDQTSFHDSVDDAQQTHQKYIDKVENGKVVKTWEYNGEYYEEFL